MKPVPLVHRADMDHMDQLISTANITWADGTTGLGADTVILTSSLPPPAGETENYRTNRGLDHSSSTVIGGFVFHVDFPWIPGHSGRTLALPTSKFQTILTLGAGILFACLGSFIMYLHMQ
jgi:hypothetical protein